MKKISRIILIMGAVLLLTGCMQVDKEAMTAKEFKSSMEDQGFTVIDETESGDGDYQAIYTATDEEKYSFEYYFMKSDTAATTVYDYARNNLETQYSEDDTVVIIETSNDYQAEYSVTASDYYCFVARVDNSVLYVTACAEYKDDTDDILKNLGY